ncbi:nucleotidyltransferase domain-containing protein [Shimia marina]|uniref:nucleotidyltransferase domain-containing protein n=1 Tax=Shimia marina TaxID=321267 RepID=UPI00071D4F9F|nr:nucleotidyltransferase domain-containing protein [Shimia marina]
MSQKLSAALSAAEKIRDQFYPEASACMLAGSVVRGDATAYSDLDLVVVFERVENAQRQSFFSGAGQLRYSFTILKLWNTSFVKWTVRRECRLYPTWSAKA